MRVAQGDLPGALQAFTESKNIADKLAAADPGNAQWQRDLSVSWNKLGDVRVAQGDLPGALQAFTESKNIRDKLAAADPGNAEWQRDLSVSWNRLGDVREAQGDLPGALQAYTETRTSPTSSPPPTPATPGGSATSRSAGTISATCAWPRATCRAPSRPSPRARTSATGSPPPTPATPSGSATSPSAGTSSATYAGPRATCRAPSKPSPRARSIRARLAAADPGNAEWQRDLIVSHWNLADLLERMPDRAAEAAGHWSQALAIARTLADTGRLAPTDAYFVETLEQRLAAAPTAPGPPP